MKKLFIVLSLCLPVFQSAFSQEETYPKKDSISPAIQGAIKLNITNTIGRTFTIMSEHFNKKGNSFSIGGSYTGQYDESDYLVGGGLIIEHRTYFNTGNDYNLYFMPFVKAGYFEAKSVRYSYGYYDQNNNYIGGINGNSYTTTQRLTGGITFGLQQYIGRLVFDVFIGPALILAQEDRSRTLYSSGDLSFPFDMKGVFVRSGISLGLTR